MKKDKIIEYGIDIGKSLLISIIKDKIFPSKKQKQKIIYQTVPAIKKPNVTRRFFNLAKKATIAGLFKEFVYNRVKAKVFTSRDARNYSWVMEYPLMIVDLEDYINELDKNSIVLDLGSGSGYFSIKLAQYLASKGKVIAVDMNKKSLKSLQNNAKAARVSNIEIHRANIQKLPFEKEYADCAFLNMTYGQLINKHKSIFEIERVLKKNGKLYITELMVDPFYSFKSRIVSNAKKAGFELIKTKGNFLNYTLIFEKK